MPSPVPPSLSEHFDTFRQLHRPGRPLFLPNAWDFTSAAALARAGYRAIGTTSLGVAVSAGKPDAAAASRAETIALAWLLNRLPTLLTVDIEAGFSDDPFFVAELAAELAAAGAVGVNLEDGHPDGTLVPVDRHQAKIAAVRAQVPDLFINARTDTFWLAGRPTPPCSMRPCSGWRSTGRRAPTASSCRASPTRHDQHPGRRSGRPAQRALCPRPPHLGRTGPTRGGPGEHRVPAVPDRARCGRGSGGEHPAWESSDRSLRRPAMPRCSN